MSEVRLIDANALIYKNLAEVNGRLTYVLTAEEINNVPTVEPEELKRVRDICEHWNDNSSSFVSACNAFEDILHIFKMGVGDIRGDNNETN